MTPTPTPSAEPLGELTAHTESNDPSIWIDTTAFMGLIKTAEVKDGKLHVEAVAHMLSLKLVMPMSAIPKPRTIHEAVYAQPRVILESEVPDIPDCPDPSKTPSLPDAVGAYLAAVDESDALGHAPADLMEAALIKEEAALANLRTAYAQVIPS